MALELFAYKLSYIKSKYQLKILDYVVHAILKHFRTLEPSNDGLNSYDAVV